MNVCRPKSAATILTLALSAVALCGAAGACGAAEGEQTHDKVAPQAWLGSIVHDNKATVIWEGSSDQRAVRTKEWHGHRKISLTLYVTKPRPSRADLQTSCATVTLLRRPHRQSIVSGVRAHPPLSRRDPAERRFVERLRKRIVAGKARCTPVPHA